MTMAPSAAGEIELPGHTVGPFADDGRSMSPQARKSASVKMLVQLGPFNERAVWLDYSANIAGLAEKFARHVDRGIP
jgi:hypothetical protein